VGSRDTTPLQAQNCNPATSRPRTVPPRQQAITHQEGAISDANFLPLIDPA